jgi:DNA-binding transcriptional ArsR family regulator
MLDLDSTFAALSDPTRRAILARLALGEASVGELGEPFDISPPPFRGICASLKRPR